MDPRTQAKVTSPDLVKAFNEGRGVDEDATPPAQVWVIFSTGFDVERVVGYPLDQLDHALADVREHLKGSDDKGCMLFTGTEKPAIVDDAQQAISAPTE